MIRVDQPRDIYAQGEAATRYFLFYLLGIGLVFGIVIILLLERLVLARVARLSGELNVIAANGDHSARVSDDGYDELASMASSINTMINALEKTQQELKAAHEELGVRVQERTAELSALYELSRSLADVAHSYDTILNMVTSHAVKTIRVTFARVALLEKDGFVVEAAYPIRPLGHDLSVGASAPLTTMPFCKKVMEQNEPVVVSEGAGELTSAERQALFLGFTKTLCLVPLRSGQRPLGLLMLGEAREEEREPFTYEKVSLARSIGEQVSSALKRAELFKELERSYLQTVLTLANAVDAKDTYTADHGQRLADMAITVGRQAGMNADELRDLQYGAILHDVGKIGVPDSILLKPGKLDSQEWIRMRQHPEIGAQILSSVPHLAGAAAIVLGHHERYDGSGYPQGFGGDDIPLGARILAIIDAYNAIIDKRVYKEARSHEDAIAELKRCAGSQFDPGLTEMFIGLMEHDATASKDNDNPQEMAG